jgi:uncharacterized protein Yka (UPF0111/DUF47 family)
MGRTGFSSKSKRLFELMDKLHECKEDIDYSVVKSRSNRLDKVEKNAKEIEAIAIEMQQLVAEMRRK